MDEIILIKLIIPTIFLKQVGNFPKAVAVNVLFLEQNLKFLMRQTRADFRAK